MSIKSIVVIVALCLAVVFLGLDKCGSSRKVDELKGQYKEASRIAKVERLIKEETIKKQREKIGTLDRTIVVLNTTIAKKERANTKLDGSIADLEREFDDLEQQDAKIGNLIQQVAVWKEKFALSQSIIADKDDVIFSLNEKYESQVIISDSYKTMYDTLTLNTKKLQSIVTAQDQQIKKLKLTSGLKSGLAVVLAGVVLYSLLK